MRPINITVLLDILLLATGGALAQATAPPKATPTGIVTGHVFCADTNGPARLATVMLEPANAIDGYVSDTKSGVSAHLSGVQTLPDGSFILNHVAPGTYYVFASEPGYVSPLATLGVSGDQLSKPDKALKEKIARVVPRVTVQAGAPASVDVSLERGAAVSGTILYDDGSPAAGLKVELLVRQKDGKNDKWVVPRDGPEPGTPSITTDDRGTFRIASLPAREYLLDVQLHLGKIGYDINANAGYGVFPEGDYQIPIYSGSKLRARDATPFTLKLGEERPGEDITVPLGKLHSVSGSVVAARDGHTVNGGKVTLLHADDRSEFASTELSRGDTAWTLSFVPDGDYILRVTDGADLEYEEVANPPGTTPPSDFKTHSMHGYGPGEQPLHVEGELSGLAISVPEPTEKKTVARE